MALLPIIKYPNKILKRKTVPVHGLTSEIKKLISDMIETMYANGGVGLASNQVGKNLSIAVCDISQNKKSPMVFINPVITEKNGESVEEEGCLSFPNILLELKRPDSIKVKALNNKGKPFAIEAEGILSRVIQHEFEHLQGKVFIDNLPVIKRLMVCREIKQNTKKAR